MGIFNQRERYEITPREMGGGYSSRTDRNYFGSGYSRTRDANRSADFYRRRTEQDNYYGLRVKKGFFGELFRSPYFWGFMVLLAIVLYVYFTAKASGKAAAEKVTIKELPSGGSNIPAQWKESDAKALLDEVHDVVYAWLVPVLGSPTFAKREATFAKLLALTDDQATYVYNLWQRDFYKIDKETIVQAIEGENFTATGSQVVTKWRNQYKLS